MNQVSARAAETPSPATHNETTYFLCVDDPTEQKIASAWLKATYPHTKGRLTSTLPLRRLGEKAVIIPVIRGEDRSPLDERRRTTNGQHEFVRYRPDELIGEVRECKPVRAADHWRGKTDEWDAFGGNLMDEPFMSALAASSTPAIPKTHIGTPDMLKLSWI